MDLIRLTPSPSFVPILLVVGVCALGFLSVAGGRKAGRVVAWPFLALLAAVLLLAAMLGR